MGPSNSFLSWSPDGEHLLKVPKVLSENLRILSLRPAVLKIKTQLPFLNSIVTQTSNDKNQRKETYWGGHVERGYREDQFWGLDMMFRFKWSRRYP